ncbi:MAG: septum formation protein Maf [Anaerolineales bacterium]|nr:septum formation protein Maf [Anaerolineales bacterium]
MISFILASQSPRRQALLGLVGFPFEVQIANANEESVTDSNPSVNVVETARLKANMIANHIKRPFPSHTILIAADTTVVLDDQMLGKPNSTYQARQMLIALRNRKHAVHTGLVLLDFSSGMEVTGVHTAYVTMRNYGDDEIEAYVASGDPMDKAGAYAIQHPQFNPVAQLDGCYLGVMGLSVCHLLHLLTHFNVPLAADLTAVSTAHQQYPCQLFNQLTRK